MYCEECGVMPASVRFETNINGVSRTRNLCTECAQKYQNGFLLPISFTSFFKGSANMQQDDSIKCKTCGTTFMDFKTSGLLGCEDCYTYFAKQLQPIIDRIQKTSQHIENDLEVSAQNAVSEDDSLTTLNDELCEAISREEFERAAAIRDIIKDKKAALVSRKEDRDEQG